MRRRAPQLGTRRRLAEVEGDCHLLLGASFFAYSADYVTSSLRSRRLLVSGKAMFSKRNAGSFSGASRLNRALEV